MARPGALDQRIVDEALAAAETVGWGRLRLREVAERVGIPLRELRAIYRDKDAVGDAWLARADAAMLAPPPDGFAALAPPERLHFVIMAWLDALAPHRRVTGDIIKEKLWPFHPHHNVALVFWVSRTVQWIREAALLDAGGVRRQLEEIGLTNLFLGTLAYWLRDDSIGQTDTRDMLARALERADDVMGWLWPAAGGKGRGG